MRKLGLIDYPTIIKHPMDLGTVKRKLERREYKAEEEIRRDLDLIWGNCKKYNKPGSTIYKAAEKMERSCGHLLSKFPSHSTMLRKRNPLDETRNLDDGTLSVKVLLFKKLKELDSTKLRELIQELIRKHPNCVKEVNLCLTQIENDGLKIRFDELGTEQLRDLIKFVDGFINVAERPIENHHHA